MRRTMLIGAVLVMTAALPGFSAAASTAGAAACGGGAAKQGCPETTAKDDGFNTDGQIFVPPRGPRGPVEPIMNGPRGPQSPTYTERRYVIACTGNGPDNPADTLCAAATETCPVEGEIRHWVY